MGESQRETQSEEENFRDKQKRTVKKRKNNQTLQCLFQYHSQTQRQYIRNPTHNMASMIIEQKPQGS